MTRSTRLTLGLASITLLALLSACSGGTENHSTATRQPVPAAPAQPALPGLPPLPADPPPAGGAPRAASVNLNLSLDGVDFFATNVLPDSISSLQLAPNTGEVGPLAWAVYRLAGLAPDANVSTLSAALSQLEPGQDYYFALADFSSGSWELFTRTAPSAESTFNLASGIALERHLSPAGNLYFAVLAHDHGCFVDFISLLASTSLAAPQNLLASDGTNPLAVLLTWDVVPGAEMYEVFYKEAGQPDEFYGFLTVESGDTDSPGFSHTADYPPGKTAIYGTEYEYKVRSTAGGEDPSAFGAPDTGRRQLPAPADFSATDSVHPERVAVAFRSPQTWPGMRAFQLFRDGEFTGVENFTTIGDWFFMFYDEPDLDVHEYYVIETGPEGDSPPSAVDSGSRAEWVHTLIASSDVFLGQYRSDLNYAAHDPALPALCYHEQATNWIRYGWVTPELIPAHYQVFQAEVDANMSLLPFGGRPWIAFDTTGEAYGAQGVYIARGKVAAPTGPDDWDVYALELGTRRGDNIELGVINGRLAVVFATQPDEEYRLRFGFATTDDPQGPGDWTITDIAASPGNELLEHFALIQFQGGPLVAYQGHEGLSLAQADTPTPGGSGDWTHYELPLSGRIASRAEGVDLVSFNGMVHVASMEGGAESPGEMIVSRATSWPPGPADWEETEFFTSNAIMHGGISMVLFKGRPWLLWSGEDRDGGTITTPALLEDDLLWNITQWARYDLLPDEKYKESIYNVRLVITGNGEPAAMYTLEYYDSGYKYDLYCSQLVPHV